MPDVLEPMAPLPTTGRVFERSRRVRLGDVSPAGRLRFDGLTRYLQDVSDDDTRDAGMSGEMTWVVRRTVIDVAQFPVLGEELVLHTFCGATGPRWADRRVRLTGDRGGWADAATLWVFVDERGRPAPLPEGFMATFGEAAGGRTVRAKLTLGDPPPDGTATWPWPTRFTDFDVLGHMNNAAYWSAVEEVLSARRQLRAPLRATIEFRTAVEAGDAVSIVTADSETGVQLWLRGGDTVFASAAVARTLPGPT